MTWLFLLMPLALLRVVTEGTGKKWLSAWKYIAVGLLLLNFLPYTAREIQSVIYPQLETEGVTYQPRRMLGWIGLDFRTRLAVISLIILKRETFLTGWSTHNLLSRLSM